MLYTLADARPACGRFVESGTAKPAVIDARINEALERLLDLLPLECLRRTMRVCTQGRSFALPHNVEKILTACVNGVPARVFGQAYQFLDSGPGDDAFRSQGGSQQDLEDLGDDWPIMYEVPTAFSLDAGVTCVGASGWSLAIFSPEEADVGKVVGLSGFKTNAEALTDELTVNRWNDGTEGAMKGTWGSSLATSAQLFGGLWRVTLPAGLAGYCSLYAVDASTDYTYFLAKYHPSVLLPQFRRYRITNQGHDDVVNLLLQVQLRHVPLVLGTDVLPVNSIQAVKLAVMALREENQGNLQAAVDAMNMAVGVLAKREEANIMTKGTPVVVDTMRRMALQSQATRGLLL